MIKDSGDRTQFDTGAVRDMHEGKGRCDLLPLDVIAEYLDDERLRCLAKYEDDGNTENIEKALCEFAKAEYGGSSYTMFLEVAKHFEDGCLKYGENNWRKGIKVHSYIDSAIRHYLKHRREDNDEPHERAFVWNLLCAIWTIRNKPELQDIPARTKLEEGDE